MTERTFLTSTLFLISSLICGGAAAINLYEQDFESGVLNEATPNPVWSIKSRSLGPVTGPGNLFELVKGHAHTGEYSLRFNYDGLNGRCNLCGDSKQVHKTGYNESLFFISNSGGDLTAAPINSEIGRLIYNIDNGFSKWRILSIDNKDAVRDKLTLQKLADNINGLTSQFSGGDNVLVAKECGIDGSIGGNIDRRSDCNAAITYFGGVTQEYGESLYRRLYFKIDTNADLPSIQKLRYWDTSNGSLYVTIESRQGSTFSQLAVGGVIPGMPRMTRPKDGIIKKGMWYYFEEEFKTESSPGANNGEYRLWFNRSGSENNSLLLEWTGMGLLPVSTTSLWGNHQHTNDSHGYWYIDDFIISTNRNGAVVRPNAPDPFQAN